MNLYHILYKNPTYIDGKIFIIYEELAQKLVKSGLLRIDAIEKINFARFIIASRGLNKIFSARELYDKNLLQKTKQFIGNSLKLDFAGDRLKEEIERRIFYLKAELKKYQYIDEETELKLARIIVQSAHPIIIYMILLENVEVFISYSHNIGDMLDNHSWQYSGSNSGMQSNDQRDASIFVSAGGDPFAKTENPLYGDGEPALARMSIIAAQELGHYADLIRNNRGKKISRFSMDISGYRAKEPTRTYRINDMKNLNLIYNIVIADNYWFKLLYESEEKLKFFRKNRPKDFTIIFTKMNIFFRKIFFRLSLKKNMIILFSESNKREYLSLSILDMILDMKFNLDPQADVYRDKNKMVEEAIKCAESLARVPQQTVKWGEKITKLAYPNLYKFYYDNVINNNIDYYEKFTNTKFSFPKKMMKIKPNLKILSRIYNFIFRKNRL